MSYQWRDIDFRPAPAGWRVIFVAPKPPHWFSRPLAGWIIQEQAHLDHRGHVEADNLAASDRDRRIVAGVHDPEGQLVLEAAISDWYGEVWLVVGPGQEDPTTNEAKQAFDQRMPSSRILGESTA